MSDLPPDVQSLLDALRVRLSATQSNGLSVRQVAEKYLTWCKSNRSKRTYELSQKYLCQFVASLRDGMQAGEVKPYHVREWIDSHPTWAANQQRAVIAAITTPFNWAAEQGYPGCSGLAGVKRPGSTKRESKLTPDDFQQLLAAIGECDPFRDLLVFMWECGCRPQEARHIEARHVRLDQHRIEIPAIEAKGKRRWRVIYLSPVAEAIVTGLVSQYPDGKLFRNSRGTPWSVYSVNCRFGRLKDVIGKRFSPYDFRHAFATRMLKAGHDPITVSNLLGHKDAAMLCKHYEGISGDGAHLLNAVKPQEPPSVPSPSAGKKARSESDDCEGTIG